MRKMFQTPNWILPPVGLEPTTHKGKDFKSFVFTNFTTEAGRNHHHEGPPMEEGPWTLHEVSFYSWPLAIGPYDVFTLPSCNSNPFIHFRWKWDHDHMFLTRNRAFVVDHPKPSNQPLQYEKTDHESRRCTDDAHYFLPVAKNTAFSKSRDTCW